MEIQFYGGAQTVTGSQHLLRIHGHRILMECGLFQGRRSETYEKNLNFEHHPEELDAMLLSHAHIDHSGNIPNLVKQGFTAKIHATHATADLADLMLRDSAYLQEKDAEWVNKRRRSKGEDPIDPLYKLEDTEKALAMFHGQDYENAFTVVPGVKASFIDTGHILGSAGILVEFEKDGKPFRLGFSGDVGRHDVPILRDPVPMKDLDALIIESTYGNREHEKTESARDELAEIINHVYKRGGKLIIPAFAVGRTQMLVYMIHTLYEEKKIPQQPVYVDSPMACNAIDIFRNHPECYDADSYEHFMTDHHDPLAPPGMACIRATEDSKKLNFIDEPQIIISASGMMEGGRVLHHLKNNIHDPKNMLLFVGFAAPHTLARRLMDGKKQVRIFGDGYDVKIEIRTMPYFSGHADYHGLLKMMKRCSPDRLKNIFLVHGEKEPGEALKSLMMEQGFSNIEIPERLDRFTI